MLYSTNSLVGSEPENEFNSFIESILTPFVILKSQKNEDGKIMDFRIEEINDAAALSLNSRKENLTGLLFFQSLRNKGNSVLFKKLCYVENSGFIFYRKNFKDYPFNKLKSYVRIKASRYNDKILLNWFDSPDIDKLALFSENNRRLRKSLKDNSKTLTEIEELNDFYKILGNTIPYGGWMSDSEGTVLHISDSFLKLFGTTREEVFEKGWLNFVDKDEVEGIKKLWENSLKGKQIFNAEFNVFGIDKKSHSILSTAYPLLDEDSNVKYWVGIHLMNDKNKETENKIKELLGKYKQSNEELQQFAYIASHDLQEPLRMVTSFTQLLERRYKDKLDEDGKEFINFAVDGAKRMKNLIDGLLSYSRVITHSKNPDRIDVQWLINNLINDLDFIIKENNAKISYGNLPVIYADKNQIYQLFQNLIMNGLKYRRKEAPVINISAKKEDSKWLFEISDNGIGIEQKFFDRIFVIFQRLHSRDKYEGTGIGLAVCKRIVERMGGEIWVKSEIDRGSTFYFTIPERLK